MAKTKEQKRKQKRKERLKERLSQHTRESREERFAFLLNEAKWFSRTNPEKALERVQRSLKLFPDDEDAIGLMGLLAGHLNKPEIEMQAFERLDKIVELTPDQLERYLRLLYGQKRYREAIAIAERGIEKTKDSTDPQTKNLKTFFSRMKDYAGFQIDEKSEQKTAEKKAIEKKDLLKKEKAKKSPAEKPEKATLPERPENEDTAEAVPAEENREGKVKAPRRDIDIPVSVKIDTRGLEATLSEQLQSPPEAYWLALEAYQVRLNETFDRLICLSGLTNVASLWYQEETAKKILKRFRGRALLADEVGLGKTIEALLVFSEYYQRGMIKNGLILTPTPLVSQWRGELASKFGLDFPTTDDPEYRTQGDKFWEAPFIVASINLAKSKKNFEAVTRREYDIVIVDEAHHLKNRTTLNWKLVNALKKKYLLMLSATPVENNLMELYNLITLLKPGQLKTASAFKEEFMTRGDPTDPQNREKLRSLLGEVMIRNTRAVAKVDLPPRFAHTLRVDPTKEEQALYQSIEALIREMGKRKTANRLLLKNLLAEAGSSPRAVQLALQRRLENREVPKAEEKKIKDILDICAGIKKTRKNRMLLDLLKGNPDKIIIFVKYLGTLEHLSGFLEENRKPYAIFHGSMSNAEKDAQVERFTGEDVHILLTTEIGGEGRNLQFCNKMINYDLPWNPMKIEQRIGRIHRIGQEKEVTIFNFCGAGSIEDYILEILDKKINMFEMVIGEIDMILGRIRGEQDFSDMVYEIWMDAESDEDRKTGFDRLASRLKRSKSSYLKTRELDDKLFEDSYEI